jgi:hypothetical protein
MRFMLPLTFVVASLMLSWNLGTNAAEPDLQVDKNCATVAPSTGDKTVQPPKNLTEALANCNGVLAPPKVGDREMTVPPPKTGSTMPVIPPSALPPQQSPPG